MSEKRLSGETFTEYKQRMADEGTLLRVYLKGHVYTSSPSMVNRKMRRAALKNQSAQSKELK